MLLTPQYFYLFINLGGLTGTISTAYCEKVRKRSAFELDLLMHNSQYVGFWLAFTIPTIALLIAPVVLLVGRHRYADSSPQGFVLPTAIRVWRTAASGRWSLNPITTWKRMHESGFWEAAKPSVFLMRSNANANDERAKRMTWDDQWVEEIRRGFKACKVFMWYPIYCERCSALLNALIMKQTDEGITYSQVTSNLVSQAATMRTNDLPNDILFNLDSLTLIIFIPICDMLIYPALSRLGWRLTPLKKITLGFLIGAVAMFWAATVQHFIYKVCQGTHGD
jgi:POT family proton-dependent oligopeptide transporter